MIYFEGKHAVVTGGGSGIGAAIAKSLGDAGASVTIIGRHADKLTGVADALGAAQQVAEARSLVEQTENLQED